MLLVEPSEAMAKRISRGRLTPMLRDSPALASRVVPARSRVSSSSLLFKSYPGGHLILAGSNSPTALASDPIRWVFFDEVDKYPPTAGDDADPVSLGMKRSTTFWDRRHVLASTPTIEGSSTIEKWYHQGDQRRFHVPCPSCGRMDYLTWNDEGHFTVAFKDRDPSTARLRCPACFYEAQDHERRAMVAAGEWRATAQFRGIISFHISELYASTSSLKRIVTNFLRAREMGREELREFFNQTLGLPWRDEAARVESHALLSRLERYAAPVPRGVLFLTCGVDVQDDRLEARVWGWGQGEETWLIDVRTFPGDPAKPEPWQMLDDLLDTEWQHERGHRPKIAATAVDSGGHRTDHVYAYVERNRHRRVYATIGRDGQRAIWTPAIQSRPGPGRRRCPLSVVGVDSAKALIVSRLLLQTPGPGYVHLPVHPAVTESEVDQLTSEELATVYDKRKRRKQVWRLRSHGVRNEGLDCFVLALWALRALRPDLEAAASELERPAPAPAPAKPVKVEAPRPFETTKPVGQPRPPAPTSARGWRVTRAVLPS
jgi:phage terminase large subunit GpA-like protein